MQHKEGHFIWLETSISPINKGNKVVSFVASNRDVTQWMLAKKEIEDWVVNYRGSYGKLIFRNGAQYYVLLINIIVC